MNRYKVLYTILFWSYVIGMYAQEIQQADSVRRNWSRLTDNKPAVFSIDKIKFGPEPVFEEPRPYFKKIYKTRSNYQHLVAFHVPWLIRLFDEKSNDPSYGQ